MQPPELDNFPMPELPAYYGREILPARCTLCDNTGIASVTQAWEYGGGRHVCAGVEVLAVECDCKPEYAEGY